MSRLVGVFAAVVLLVAACASSSAPPTAPTNPTAPTTPTASQPTTTPGAPSAPSTPGVTPAPATPAPTAAPGPLVYVETGRVPVQADGALHADPSGVGLVVPPDAVEGGGGVQLIASTGAGWLVDQLRAVADLQSSFYRVIVDGDRDTRRPLELRFPATGPAFRVASIVDGTYLFVYAVEPADGVLAIQVSAPPATPPDLGGDPMAAPGDVQYVVIGPAPTATTAAATRDARPMAAAAAFYRGGTLAAPAPAPSRWCVAFGDIPVELRTCRMNASGSVQVSWARPDLIGEAAADGVIAAVENGMSRYAGIGLTAAKIGALEPVKVVVRPGDESLTYNSTLGVVRMGAVATGKIGTEAARFELWHELFHWVQDENYAMFSGFVTGDGRWWLETSAEVGGFLVDPGAAEHNAILYGRSSLSERHTLVFQLSPFEWVTEEQYVHAQLLRANICPSGCPLTQASFAAAINAGAYPLQAATARAAVRANFDRYVTYVLTGVLDGADTVAPFRAGTAIGDWISIGGSSAEPFELDTSAYPPQVDKATAVIEAQLQPDSVYPLWLASGPVAQLATGKTLSVGQPAMLTVSAGTEVYYTVDAGKVQHHAGSTPLVIGPIQMYIGAPEVRILAVARASAATFKATITPIDLSGDWLFSLASAKLVSTTCPPEDGEVSAPKRDLLTDLARYAAVRGSYVAHDARTPGDLEYVMDPGKSFKEKPDDPEVTYESTLTVEDETVTVHLEVVTPASGEASRGGAPDPALLLAAGPIGLAALWRRRRRWAGLIAVILVASLAAGCAGVGITGSITVDLAFSKLEYLGPKAPDDQPQWRLTGGKGNIVLDLTSAVTVIDPDGTETTEARRCVLDAAITSVGTLYLDGVVKAPAGL